MPQRRNFGVIGYTNSIVGIDGSLPKNTKNGVFLFTKHNQKKKMAIMVHFYKLKRNQTFYVFRISKLHFADYQLKLILLNSNLNYNAIKTNDNQNNNNLPLQIASLVDQLSDEEMLTIEPYHNGKYSIIFNKQHFRLCKHMIMNNINEPIFIENEFQTTISHPQQLKLSKQAQRLLTTENAGGESELSEAWSFEILRRMFGAKLLKTEMEIKYWSAHCKITDYSITIDNKPYGVSVTRAMKYKDIFTREDALKLLTKKLIGVNESTDAVLQCDQWNRQFLHIWSTHKYIVNVLKKVVKELMMTQPELTNNTIILVTVAQDIEWIFHQNKYFNKTKKVKKTKKKRNRTKKRMNRKYRKLMKKVRHFDINIICSFLLQFLLMITILMLILNNYLSISINVIL